MLKTFKTEIDPTPEQRILILQTIGVCRYVYNFYITQTKEWHARGQPFQNAFAFSKWLNKEYLPMHPEKAWIKSVSSKSVKQAICNADTAFKRFFKGLSGFPHYKKKGKSDPGMYFIRNNVGDCLCERHRIKIPTLGWVKLKEKGYVPTSKNDYVVKSGMITVQAGRYYISALVDMPDKEHTVSKNSGIGIDLGIKEFAVLSDGRIYENINKTTQIRKLEKKLKRAQRALSRMYENKKKGGATQFKNIEKQRLKLQRLHQKLDNIRTDYVNKVIAEIVKTKPSYLSLEDLNVSGMMKNRHLSKAIASQKFYEFRRRLTSKAKEYGIEVRIVDRWYPSSKLCHACGRRKANLTLSDRVFACECGYREDRDVNASRNLRDAKVYTVA